MSFVLVNHLFVSDLLQKQLSEVFCKKGVLQNFAKFTVKHLCQSLFFNKVADHKKNWRFTFFMLERSVIQTTKELKGNRM